MVNHLLKCDEFVPQLMEAMSFNQKLDSDLGNLSHQVLHSSSLPLKVVHFTGTYEQGKDGVTRVLHHIEEYNSRNEIKSMIITPVPDPRRNIYQLPTPAISLPSYDGYKIAVPQLRNIERQLRLFNPDIIHFHSPCPLAFTAHTLAKKLNIPCVATYHTHFPSYFKYHNKHVAAGAEQLFRWYNTKVYKHCTTVFVPSKTVLSELEHDGMRNGYFLSHGVDTTTFNPKFRSSEWRKNILGDDEPTTPILLYVGRLVWEKNLRIMAEAYNQLRNTIGNVHLVLAGTGPAEQELRELLPSAVFLGYTTGIDLSTAYASSDIFLFPSDTETFGLVTAEAMSSGLTAVVADAGGSADLVNHDVNGLKFTYNNPNELAQLLTDVIQNKERRERISVTALHERDSLSWDSVLSEMTSRYHHDINQHKLNSPHKIKTKRHVPVWKAHSKSTSVGT
jgi:phosphatidylinositol alpha 1,6-mannosyltransferase